VNNKLSNYFTALLKKCLKSLLASLKFYISSYARSIRCDSVSLNPSNHQNQNEEIESKKDESFDQFHVNLQIRIIYRDIQ